MWTCSYSRSLNCSPYHLCRPRCAFPELFMKRMVALKEKREKIAAEIRDHFFQE